MVFSNKRLFSFSKVVHAQLIDEVRKLKTFWFLSPDSVVCQILLELTDFWLSYFNNKKDGRFLRHSV